MSTPQIIRVAAEIVGQHVKCGWSICDRRRREDGTLPPLDVCPNIKPSCRDVAEGILADLDAAGVLAPDDPFRAARGVLTEWWLNLDHAGDPRASAVRAVIGIMDGHNAPLIQSAPDLTAEDMADWNAGTIPVAFIHPASAGHGLNLQDGGHNLVWLTLPWSLELYEQTNARLFRQGQTEPVSVVHIVAEQTIDKQVVHALEEKNVTQSALVKAVSAELGVTHG